MKSCLYCKFANWDKTAAGKLHPLGGGRCTKEFSIVVPQAFYFVGGTPKPAGGWINRKSELKDHCVFYQREVKP